MGGIQSNLLPPFESVKWRGRRRLSFNLTAVEPIRFRAPVRVIAWPVFEPSLFLPDRPKQPFGQVFPGHEGALRADRLAAIERRITRGAEALRKKL